MSKTAPVVPPYAVFASGYGNVMPENENRTSALEAITGSLSAQSVATVIAALAGGPAAALLPVLLNSLAGRRQIQRVEADIRRIETTLQAHRHRMDTLTDPQYRLLNEVVLAVLSNTEEAKRESLHSAIVGTLEAESITELRAAQVARVVREMTARELLFVVEWCQGEIQIGPVNNVTDTEDLHLVLRGTEEHDLLAGLMALGVLLPKGSAIDDAGKFVFAPFVQDLVHVLA